MPCCAAVDAAHAANFTGGIRREVVMGDEAVFRIVLFHCVYYLTVTRTAERQRRKYVRTSAVKNSGAVEHRRDAARFGIQGPDLSHSAIVGARVVLDRAAMNFLVDFVF